LVDNMIEYLYGLLVYPKIFIDGLASINDIMDFLVVLFLLNGMSIIAYVVKSRDLSWRNIGSILLSYFVSWGFLHAGPTLQLVLLFRASVVYGSLWAIIVGLLWLLLEKGGYKERTSIVIGCTLVLALLLVSLLGGYVHNANEEIITSLSKDIDTFVIEWGPFKSLNALKVYPSKHVIPLEAYWWWNESGIYVTVKYEVTEPTYVDRVWIVEMWKGKDYGGVTSLVRELYTNPAYLRSSHRIEEWMKPGEYTYTFKLSDEGIALRAYYNNASKTWYLEMPVPISNFDASSKRTYIYRLVDLKVVNKPISNETFLPIVEFPFTSPYTIAVTVVKSSDAWVYRGREWGWIRQGMVKGVPSDIFANVTGETPEEKAVNIMKEILAMIQRGLEIPPEQVIGATWWAKGKPELEPLPRAILVMHPGDEASDPYNNWVFRYRAPRIDYEAMRKIVAGEWSVKVTLRHMERTLYGYARIGDTDITIPIVKETMYEYVVYNTPKGVKVEKHVYENYYGVFGPIDHYGYMNIPWVRIGITEKPAPGIAYYASIPLLPKLPAPEKP
jgi:hypothetical protein